MQKAKKFECWSCSIWRKSDLDFDDELWARLKELHLCPGCYEEWQDECLCGPCLFPGKPFTGNFYCLCSICEVRESGYLCPNPYKMNGSWCENMKLISKSLFNRRYEALIY